ncbi:cuticle collagen 40-like [Meriones unguiculatus]|uniref:cuticle collagen 40-like n=1 Tax=Meriones unguiculatus TaxID=10047 RepID=UPI000B4EC539|nr:cuticle collagen 40-like [Meriones unguiculatus]XP_060232180.1 cuticle collagen 40-like [Meriones unguiculatus]
MAASVAMKAEEEDPGGWRDPETSLETLPAAALWGRVRPRGDGEPPAGTVPPLAAARAALQGADAGAAGPRAVSQPPRAPAAGPRAPPAPRERGGGGGLGGLPAPSLPAGHPDFQGRGWIPDPGRMAAAGRGSPERLVQRAQRTTGAQPGRAWRTELPGTLT